MLSRLLGSVDICAGPFSVIKRAHTRTRTFRGRDSHALSLFKGVWDTLVNSPSGYIKDDILQFNQSFDSIASL